MKDWIELILSVISFLVALGLVLNYNADKKKINYLTEEVERLELECEMLRNKIDKGENSVIGGAIELKY